ncbi:MAG TPA: transaldolase family protein, partial [Candidatus Sabulitectum sp.]|nr:transaldolase family protein [Candidatus Sabulitectum sp.]HPJ29711.1 transaldolase family protein [Candidatus Sabulitectum sp.]HPR23554.1 transaldolase family protein [Candidatus Sabulitectum sp.]
VVEDLADMFDDHGFTTRIIAASIRNPGHITQAALAGAHIATVPYSVVKKAMLHPLTDKGLEAFRRDWEASKLK